MAAQALTKTQIRIRTTSAQILVAVLLILALSGCGVRTHQDSALPFVPAGQIQGVAMVASGTNSCYLAAIADLQAADATLFLGYGQLLDALDKDIAGNITGSTASIVAAHDSLDHYGAGWIAALAAVTACSTPTA